MDSTLDMSIYLYILPIQTTKIVNIAVISQIFWIIISRKNHINKEQLNLNRFQSSARHRVN